MCGIAGIISPNKIQKTDVTDGKRMTSVLRHRGPDQTGDHYDGNCYFGNTRLKIIDLSDSGNLPMSNNDRSLVLAYNGEITNFKDLKEQFRLEEKYKFRSKTDTEVLLLLYEELGIKFLEQLSGQFAFALYDKKKNKIFIVRDQFGIRPVFYMRKNDKFYFASEIKSFLEISDFNKTVDQQAVYDYFSLIYIPGVRTPFKNIKELDGGHYLEIDLNSNKTEIKEYFDFNYQPDYNMTEKEAIDGFYDVMLDSVRRNIISDAPLGLTLSGGLDTSSILSLTKELGKSSEIHTFSIKMEEASFDESRFQKIMVDHAKPIHHQINVGPKDVLEALKVQMAYMDEPNGNGAVIPSFLLAKEAKKYVKVLLSGEGGDELTNAYDTHLAYKVRKLYRKYIPSVVRSSAHFVAHRLPASFEKLSFDFLAKRFTEGAEMSAPRAHLYWRHVFNETDKRKLLNYEYNSFDRTDEIFSRDFNKLVYADGLNKISYLDWKYFFIGDLMVKNDRTFMAHSIEARFPFADKKVFDFVKKIPPRLKIKGFTPRYVQKEAMKKILPKEIYKRKSMGLEMPHSLWFLNGMEKVIDDYIKKDRIEKTEILNYSYVEKLWNDHKNMKRDNGRAIWSIINYIIWFELFIESNNYKEYLRQ